MPNYEANPTDAEQDKREVAAFENGVPHHMNGKTRVRANREGATERTARGSSIASNAGVIMSHDDTPGRDLSATQGKA